MAKKIIGKKIMAGGEPIYKFSTGECVGFTRRKCIGVIEEITEGVVKIFDKSNPKGYQNYELKRIDFDKWCEEGLYLLR